MKGVSLLPPSQTTTSASSSAREDRRVVDTGEDDVALGDVRLVLLALLDCRVGRVEVAVALESLDGLLRQVAVWHRVAQDGDALAGAAQDGRDVAGRLALPEPVRTAQMATTGFLEGLGRARAEQDVVGSRGQGRRAEVHDVLVRHVE